MIYNTDWKYFVQKHAMLYIFIHRNMYFLLSILNKCIIVFTVAATKLYRRLECQLQRTALKWKVMFSPKLNPRKSI